MKNNDVLNIVQIGVTDKVGSTSTNWDLAFVFYADGTVGIRTLDEAKEIAKENNLKIRKDDGESLTNNYKKYRTVPYFNPYAIIPVEDNNAKQEKSKEQEENKQKRNKQEKNKKESKSKKQGNETKTTKSNENDDYSESKDGNIFLRGVKKVGTFLLFPFVLGYGGIVKFCDWADEHVLSHVNKFLSKRKQKKELKEEQKNNVKKRVKEALSFNGDENYKEEGLWHGSWNKANQVSAAATFNKSADNSTENKTQTTTVVNNKESQESNTSAMSDTVKQLINKIKDLNTTQEQKDKIIDSIVRSMGIVENYSNPKVYKKNK